VRLKRPVEGGAEYVDFDRERGTEQLAPYIRETSAEAGRQARALEVWQEVPDHWE